MMILTMMIKIGKVRKNINVGNPNVKKHITPIQHSIIIAKKHIMDNFP
jgi:hypothetical protein